MATVAPEHARDFISPDLSRETPDVPDSIGVFRKPEMQKQPRRGVIYTVAPSYKDINTIWAGTDDGLIHVTRDAGKSWQNVTPPGITSWSKISIIDAGRFDASTAYAAVNRIRPDDICRAPASIIETLLHEVRPSGVTFCHDLPASRVT